MDDSVPVYFIYDGPLAEPDKLGSALDFSALVASVTLFFNL
jgi:hypothetical protein